MSQEQKKSVLRYMMPAVALGVFAFMMVMYSSAYSPPKPQKQQVVCYKFKEGVSVEAMKQHMVAFQDLKREVAQIADYSAGETFGESNKDYDVMHYLTFRSDADMEKFSKSAEYKAFVNAHEKEWEKVLVINSEIK